MMMMMMMMMVIIMIIIIIMIIMIMMMIMMKMVMMIMIMVMMMLMMMMMTMMTRMKQTTSEVSANTTETTQPLPIHTQERNTSSRNHTRNSADPWQADGCARIRSPKRNSKPPALCNTTREAAPQKRFNHCFAIPDKSTLEPQEVKYTDRNTTLGNVGTQNHKINENTHEHHLSIR